MGVEEGFEPAPGEMEKQGAEGIGQSALLVFCLRSISLCSTYAFFSWQIWDGIWLKAKKWSLPLLWPFGPHAAGEENTGLHTHHVREIRDQKGPNLQTQSRLTVPNIIRATKKRPTKIVTKYRSSQMLRLRY